MNARKSGLIGFPVEHSISPVFQQAAFDALGIDARYERWSTTTEALRERVAGLRHPEFFGANVTVPHKQAVLPLLDDVDSLAHRAGAVNTIVRRDARLFGSNTDVEGFRRALRERGPFEASGKRAVVLGAGGAARAVVLALELEGAVSIAVANRHPERAQRLVAGLRSDAGPELISLPWEDAVSPVVLRTASLLVNCTTLGLAGTSTAKESPVSAVALSPRLFVCDIVANPPLTPLLVAAREAGAPYLGGLAMLVYQGAASFELWTGAAAPIDVMMQAAEAAMQPPAQIGR
jgi:shikimate dehydrogenase